MMADPQIEEKELTDEELEQGLDDYATGNEPTEPAAEVVEEAEPEPEAIPEVTKEAAESVEVPEGDAPEEPPEDLDAEILDSRLKTIEADRDKWESVAGRHAGRMDFLERKLSAQGTAAPPMPESTESEYGDPPPAQPAPPQQQPSDKITSWAIARAIQDAGAQFAAEHPDVSEMGDDIKGYLESVNFSPDKLLLTDDPGYAQREVASVLREAHSHVIAKREAVRLTELTERKADQTQKLAKAKEKASVSAPASTPPPKPDKDKPMTDEELEKALEEATRGRY